MTQQKLKFWFIQESLKHFIQFIFKDNLIELILYSGGGFRWNKINIEIAYGKQLLKYQQNLGMKHTYKFLNTENIYEVLENLTIKFGDYNFNTLKVVVQPGSEEYFDNIKKACDLNKNIKIKCVQDEKCVIV